MVKLDTVLHSLSKPSPPDSLSRNEATTHTSISAVTIRHDGISNWSIELKGPRWSWQQEAKTIDHLRERGGIDFQDDSERLPHTSELTHSREHATIA